SRWADPLPHPHSLIVGGTAMLGCLTVALWNHSSDWLAIPVLAVVSPVILLLSKRLGTGANHHYLRELMDLPASVPQFAVEVDLSHNGAVYGSDRGLLRFVDGSLQFQGFDTIFTIVSQDVQSWKPVGSTSGLCVHCLTWKGDFRGTATFFPISQPRNDETEDPTMLWSEFDRLYRGKQVSGLSVLPPKTPQPGWQKRVSVSALWQTIALVLLGVIAYSFPSGRNVRLWDSIPADVVLAPFIGAAIAVAFSLMLQLNRLRVLWLMSKTQESSSDCLLGNLHETTSSQAIESETHQTV
ncbi:MAG TPA: hypothetical protein VG944_19430, partial [Fimbriimonas sp.]|nr:hypothetical protein [Fimbriimonas sp.]